MTEKEKIDRKKQYEVRRHVSQDISSLIKGREYETALTLLENTSEDLMEKDALYAGLAISLYQTMERMNDEEKRVSPKAKGLVEKVAQYCENKSKFFKSAAKGIVLATAITLAGYGCAPQESNVVYNDLEKTVEKTDVVDQKLSEEDKEIYNVLENLEKHGDYFQGKADQLQSDQEKRMSNLKEYQKQSAQFDKILENYLGKRK